MMDRRRNRGTLTCGLRARLSWRWTKSLRDTSLWNSPPARKVEHADGKTVAERTTFRNAKVKLREARGKKKNCFLRQHATDAEVEVEELIRSFCESMPDELQSTAEGDEECGEFWDALVSDIQLDPPKQGWRQKPGRRSRSDLLNMRAL